MAQDQQQNKSENKFWCKIFQTRYDTVGALCDENLLDKDLKYKDVGVKVSKEFYGGVLVSEAAAIKIMRKVTIGNIIGKNIVDLAKKNGFITDENIISIDGTPHAQFVNL